MSRHQSRETLTKEMMRRCETAMGYRFAKSQLLEQALIHASLRETNGVCNERLEFLGDAILGMVISEYLYLTFAEFDEGDLSLIKSEVVSRETLAEIATRLDIHRCFVCGRGMQKGEEIPVSMLANVMEAIIGAIYLDGGTEAARHVILEKFRADIEKVVKNPYQKNYKSLLQCIAQKYLAQTPYYQIVHMEGPNHTRQFTICAVIGKRNFLAGQGKNRKEAEQAAALAALQLLAIENPAIAESLHHFIPTEKKNNSREEIAQLSTLFHNSVSLLQYVVGKLHLPPLSYFKTSAMVHHQKNWNVAIALGGRLFPDTNGPTLSEAQRMAARQVLEFLAEEHSPRSVLFSPEQAAYSSALDPVPLFYRLELIGE